MPLQSRLGAAYLQGVLSSGARDQPTLPADRQLRVLLGDPPIDWETIHTRDELRAATKARGNYTEDLIRREVLAKNRRAILIFGDGHFQGRGEGLGLSGAFEREGV